VWLRALVLAGSAGCLRAVADGADQDSFGAVPDESDGGRGSPGFDTDVGDSHCEEIDFMFVIDNSVSMADEQSKLVAAIPGFIEAMRSSLPTVESFRVGVLDTDSYPNDLPPQEDPMHACPATGVDCESCDYTLGALLSKPQSAADPSASCGFRSGRSYIDGGSAAWEDEFECAALVGTEGHPVEQQAGALVTAVAPEMNDARACNHGFLRAGALLVFVIISDEEDDVSDPPPPQGGSLGDPDRWYQALVAAKGGKPENVVALGIHGGQPLFGDCVDLDARTGMGAEATPRLQTFIESFPTSFVGSVCSDDYASLFAEALEQVALGCRLFTP
jgi:hypothetical protein